MDGSVYDCASWQSKKVCRMNTGWYKKTMIQPGRNPGKATSRSQRETERVERAEAPDPISWFPGPPRHSRSWEISGSLGSLVPIVTGIRQPRVSQPLVLRDCGPAHNMELHQPIQYDSHVMVCKLVTPCAMMRQRNPSHVSQAR